MNLSNRDFVLLLVAIAVLFGVSIQCRACMRDEANRKVRTQCYESCAGGFECVIECGRIPG